MVELNSEVAETIEELYGEEVLEQYEGIAPEELLENDRENYETLFYELPGSMNPDRFADLSEEEGLQEAIEEIDSMAEEWRYRTLESVLAAEVGREDTGL